MIIIAIITIGIFLMVLERIIPDQILPESSFWWIRVILINCLQLGVIVLAGHTWEHWFDQVSIINIQLDWPDPLLAMIAYLLVTFIFYWWHRKRHDWMWAWNLFHQIHHSPARIETITSFYKHPIEIAANSLIISFTIFFICGFSVAVGGWLTLYTAVGEFIYHMNISTPHKMGYFFQRPEMHRIHHQKGKHYNNFSDLPLWDMLFGTYENPLNQDNPCGFADNKERIGFWDMMRFKNVLK